MVYRVFISHAFDHTDLYLSLLNRFERERFDWYNCSIPRNQRYGTDGAVIPDAMMEELIAERIDSCDVVVVIAKPIVSIRRWLRYELDYAKSKGKPIIAVWRRQVDKRVSRYALAQATGYIDTWHIASIIGGIQLLADEARTKRRSAAKIETVAPSIAPEPTAEETVTPLVDPTPGPLAPVEELALAPGETVSTEAASPVEVLAPVLRPGPSADAPRVPLDQIAPLNASVAPAETPQEVVRATRYRRRWWQFWRPSEPPAAEPH